MRTTLAPDPASRRIGPEATIHPDTYVGSPPGSPWPNHCSVLDSARVVDDAIVTGGASVRDRAQALDRAVVAGWALVCDLGRVEDDAVVAGEAFVGGGARVGRGAYLTEPRHILTVGPIGLVHRTVTMYRTFDGTAYGHWVIAGCWAGSLDALAKRIEIPASGWTAYGAPQYREEYRAFIAFARLRAEEWASHLPTGPEIAEFDRLRGLRASLRG